MSYKIIPKGLLRSSRSAILYICFKNGWMDVFKREEKGIFVVHLVVLFLTRTHWGEGGGTVNPKHERFAYSSYCCLTSEDCHCKVSYFVEYIMIYI